MGSVKRVLVEWGLTCENGGLEELHELINLNEHIDSHF